MTPQRPIELVNASKACAEAWLKRDAMIDADDKEGVTAMDLTCDLLQERYNSIYRQWQDLGGTSNIDSIAFPPQFTDAWSDPRTEAEKADEADWEDEQDTIRSIYKDLGVW